VQDPLGTFEVILPFDPAIDHDDPPEGERPEGYVTGEERVRRYRDTGQEKHLKFKPGATPHRLVCKQIDAAYAFSTLSEMQGLKKVEHAFLASCVAVKLADGTTIKPKKTEVNSEGVVVATREWIQQVVNKLGARAVGDVGIAAYNAALLPEGERGPFG